jgi:tachykinin-like receptor
MAVVNCLFNYLHMRDREWPFGGLYCNLNNFFAIVTVSTSVLNLTAMSIDR